MRTTRRLAALALAATAGLTLGACATTVQATGRPAPTTQGSPADPSTEDTTDTGADAGADQTTGSTGSDGEDLPEPGAGVPGDLGLCEGVLGWYGLVTLSLIPTSADGQVNPDDVVPALQALRDVPKAHQDASGELLDAAADVSRAAGDAIDRLQGGAEPLEAVGGLEQPVTAFSAACSTAGADG